MVLALLDRGADIFALSAERWTALHHAARYGHKETVLALLDRGAELNARPELRETTPLLSQSKDQEELNERANVGTPLILAAFRGHRDIVEILLQAETSHIKSTACGEDNYVSIHGTNKLTIDVQSESHLPPSSLHLNSSYPNLPFITLTTTWLIGQKGSNTPTRALTLITLSN